MTEASIELAEQEAGVDGNARLTSVNGALLTALLLVEGVTILQINQLLTLHFFIGLLLIAPVLLKTGSTAYRFIRYYTHRPAYVRRGPPHPVLRMIGPLVVLSSLAVLGTGAGLLAVKPGNADFLLTLHQGSFIVWVVLMSVHVLGHVREAATNTWHEVRPPAGDVAARRRLVRTVTIAVVLALGVGTAVTFTPAGSSWSTYRNNRHDRPGGQ